MMNIVPTNIDKRVLRSQLLSLRQAMRPHLKQQHDDAICRGVRSLIYARHELNAVVALYALLSLYASMASDLRALAEAMEQTTQGNLCVKIPVRGRDEFAQLVLLLDHMVIALSGMVANIRSNAALVAHAGKGLAEDSRTLADRTRQRAANLEQTAASVAQLSDAVQSNAHTACAADQRASQVSRAADEGVQAMPRRCNRSMPSSKARGA